MGKIIINPGTGDVENATEKNAIENIKHWITDCSAENLKWLRLPDKDDRGRFCFLIYQDTENAGIHHYVDMPGLPLDKVRYMDSETQNIWNFPRLYVDGSSWVWMYSLLGKEDFERE